MGTQMTTTGSRERGALTTNADNHEEANASLIQTPSNSARLVEVYLISFDSLPQR